MLTSSPARRFLPVGGPLPGAPTRPALRWFGGKWRIARWIVAQFPPHRVYVEPFGGAASVLLRKPRAYAEVYNDLDGEAVNFFRVLRDPEQSLRLVEAIRLTPFARDEFISARATCAEPVERARRLAIRSHMGFGANAASRKSTGFRGNSNRSNTTPAHDWSSYPDALALIAERLRGVVIENRDALEVMRQHDSPETLHYVDPPYLWGTRYSRDNYAHEMDDEHHARLLSALRTLRGGVIVSGYASDLYTNLLHDWRHVSRRALADGARERTENLWLNRHVTDMASFGRIL